MTSSDHKKVVFLESIEGIETLFTRGLRTGAAQAGWQTSVHFLRDQNETSFSTDGIVQKLKKEEPDLICFLMDAALPWENLWEEEFLYQTPKFSFWFDDFLRSPHTLEHPKRWEYWQKQRRVKTFVWDGYWRNEWEKMTHAQAHPIHLAADETQFDPKADALFPEFKDFAVMLGTIPALASLQKEMNALPSVMQKILQDCMDFLEKAPWPILPYAYADEMIQKSPEKIKNVAQQWMQVPVQRALFYHTLWRWGKRIARLRGLKAVAKTCPVAVLSGHHTEAFAREEEMRKHLSPNAHFEFRDTTEVPANHWSGLFHSGKFQIQITDPQSMEGGIPFRVFECAAAEVPLLSDARKELSELFPSLPTAKDEDELSAKASQMFSQDLQPLAHEMRNIFLSHHTWQARWQQIIAAKF